MDRFGLRVLVSGLKENPDRLEAYRRVKAYLTHPLALINEYRLETEIAREEILAARERLPRPIKRKFFVRTGYSLDFSAWRTGWKAKK